ncbi:FtsK/SpoIIIE family DNA translocase [Gimibacter soli]|uniref:DNA translocase FtsK n=1 Tax=Gimibacter soli TaxID=3024400 RepID=A0AAF0BHU0_9PROT|nr:DNA translocase FtsK 4TM domain-containing protein [Gimibacter soli]WCL54613.1 DNA translocase FtsK 4TM domain-containing protein [Gimibacter soli]
MKRTAGKKPGKAQAAASRSPRRVSSKPAARKGGAAPILPPAVVTGLKSTAWRGFGLLLMALGVMLVLSLATYNPMDPTLNRIADGPVTNMMGAPGAAVADILMQTLALGAYLLALPLLVWGFKIARLKWLRLFWINLAFLPVGVILLSTAISVVAPGGDFPVQAGYGGALGQMFYSYVITLFGALVLPKWIFALVFVALGLPAYAVSLALSGEEWRTIARGIYIAVAMSWRWLKWGLAHSVLAVVKAAGFAKGRVAEQTASRRAARAVRREPVIGEAADHAPVFVDTEPDDDDLPPFEMDETPASRSRVKARQDPVKGKREEIEAQRAFDLGDSDGFRLPPLELLAPPKPGEKIDSLSTEALDGNARMLESVLDDFGVKGDINDVRPGPVVTLYELEPARGTKSARVIGLADDIARSMSAISARVAVVPGRNAIGIELPNQKRETVYLRELLASREYEMTKARLPVALGKDIGGAPVIADLATMPHLLVAGTTGSGKSVGINTMIESLLYRHTPETLRLIMVDPKMLELSIYDDIPHLLTPVVTEAKKAVVALKWAVREMETRYRNMSRLGVRNLAAFNKRIEEARANGEELVREVQVGFDKETGQPMYEEQRFDFQPLPYIVIIIDEMADLMLVAGKDVEATVQRLAQMARAAGIHLIMATQRPSVDVITGTIKANFPTRISFQVTSKIDSRTILGEQGAEQLLGMGDMLYMAGGGRITRVHGAFVSDEEVQSIVDHLKLQGQPDYKAEVTEEPEEGFDSPFIPGPSGGGNSGDDASLYDQAVDIVLRDRRPTTSYIQRRLKIGYNKAASLIEEMEQQGVISAPNAKGQREVLVPAREEEY